MTSDSLETTLLAASQIDWAFLLDVPLRVTLIIVGALIINFLMRIVIRRFAASVAKGTVGSSKSTSRFSTSAMESQFTGIDQATIRERRAQRAQTVGRMLSSVTSIVIAVVASLIVLSELNFNVGPILASAGIAGVAIGFGAQALVKDYLSGFFMVIEDQYGIGDSVDLGEAIGTVEDVGLRTTQVRGLDGTLWHVRNGEILRVGNQSQGWARAVLDIPVAYNTSVATYSKVIADTTKVIEEDPEIADAILEPPEIWGVESLSAQSQVIRTVLKTKPNQQWKVARAFRAELKRQMDKYGIHIPITQETVFRTLPDPTEAAKIKATNDAEDDSEDHDRESASAGGSGKSPAPGRASGGRSTGSRSGAGHKGTGNPDGRKR
ncbi:mechanosensitive ion channel family protein [Brevibacterium sp. XM4083]|uniref:mechanosensitive ion channel family protein n=1 Tax=Brevibacterium sp. XM4083 TaxID=2583238 RepID=UPI001129767A|nr:mechanosensitive ion channel family protein [Brevibacterium sp. XM4083]MCM1012198.1 mechanosensitive ion channel family protein [Brevibacterium sp. XM4083]